MTLWARRSEANPQNIEVSCTYGPTEFKVTEHQDHVRQFWGQLGELLKQEDAEVKAET